jgi:hypothetical protein
MPERREDPAVLAAALRDASPGWPPTPDLASAVRPRLAPRQSSRRRVCAWLVAVLAGAVTATMAIEPARSAVLEFLGLRSVRVERRAPDPSPRPFGAELDLGRPVMLAQAGRQAGLAVTAPRVLGEPDSVWVRETPGVVSLVYRDPGILVQVLDARLEAPIIGKAAGPGVRIERVRGGYFLSGAPHGVGYIGSDGVPVVEGQRLAGNTLIVERGRVLIRVEGPLSRDRALRIADATRVTRVRP